MAVVINDFEIVSDEGERLQRATSPADNRPAATNSPKPSLTAHDIERIVEHQHERMERVWAH